MNFNEDLQLAYEDLVDEGLIDPDSDEAGVARQVIHQGFDSMTPRQRHTYDTQLDSSAENLYLLRSRIDRKNDWRYCAEAFQPLINKSKCI